MQKDEFDELWDKVMWEFEHGDADEMLNLVDESLARQGTTIEEILNTPTDD